MWSNSTRKVLISAVYEYLFWEKLEVRNDFEVEWDSLFNEHNKDNESISIAELSALLDNFITNKDSYCTKIQKYINDWSKTYDLIKAVLITLVIELEIANPQEPEKLISKYIRISQNLVGGENPSLVHAVSSRIITDYTNNNL